MAQILRDVSNHRAVLEGKTSSPRCPSFVNLHLEETNTLVRVALTRAVEAAPIRSKNLHAALTSALCTKQDLDRAWFVRLGYECFSTDWQRSLRAMTSSEISYASVVILDDIVDRGQSRHGSPCLYRSIGIDAAIYASEILRSLAGRELISACADCALDTAHTRLVLDSYETAFCDLNHGQFLDVTLSGSNPDSVTDADYLKLVELTTGRDIANCLCTGARLAGADSRQVRLMRQVGCSVGVLMQIRDDLLDYAPSGEQINKVPGRDLAMQRPKLPFLVACRLGVIRRQDIGENLDAQDLEHLRACVLDKRTILEVHRVAKPVHIRLRKHLEGMDLPSPAAELLSFLVEDLLAPGGLRLPSDEDSKLDGVACA